MEIEYKRKHICNEGCANIWFMGFMNAGPNPKWNNETKKCSDEGQEENRCPSICSWLGDKKSFGLVGADDIVVERGIVKIEFSYPFKDSFVFEFISYGTSTLNLISFDFFKSSGSIVEERIMTLVS